ncbi:MAG: outer membrane beta-barrel protein, partial [Rhodomicrobium sp.]
MNMLHRKLVGLTVVGAFPLAPMAANAADLYRTPAPPPSYAAPAPYIAANTWAGFYAGINGGYAWSGSGTTLDYSGAVTDSSGRAQPQGGFGGGQIGYNFQSGSIVYGVETDFQGGDISDRVSGVSTGGTAYTSQERVDWFGTVRGRLGYAMGNTLIYGTGGFAYGDVRQHANVGGDVLASSGTQTGWVAGGGIEYKINPAWSLKGEYQYVDFGTAKLTDAANAVTTNSLDT